MQRRELERWAELGLGQRQEAGDRGEPGRGERRYELGERVPGEERDAIGAWQRRVEPAHRRATGRIAGGVANVFVLLEAGDAGVHRRERGLGAEAERTGGAPAEHVGLARHQPCSQGSSARNTTCSSSNGSDSTTMEVRQ